MKRLSRQSRAFPDGAALKQRRERSRPWADAAGGEQKMKRLSRQSRALPGDAASKQRRPRRPGADAAGGEQR